jgi:CheY-like chemotaxis protein
MAKILYVEDDENLGFVTKDNLEEEGFEIVHYPDGKEAFKNFKKDKFDLCLLDVNLPELDGFSLAEKIREQNQHIPIIFLTAKTLQEDKIEGLKIGGDDYITKPFSIEELTLRIKVFLKRSTIADEEEETGEYDIVAKYGYAEYPSNPNGSDYNSAMMCDKTGRHLVTMPHIERSTFPWNWAYYPEDRKADKVSPWLEAFVNAREWIEKQN